MIHPDIKPIGNVSPLPRIQIGQPDRKQEYVDPINQLAAQLRQIEGDRIWALVEETCNGHGASA